MNSLIKDNINQWDVEFDPYNFIENENWIENSEKAEDMLQIHHVYGRLIIDVGWYQKEFIACVVANKNWDKPVEKYKSESGSDINKCVCNWIEKYANWDE